MSIHMQREINKLKRKVLNLGALVEESVDRAVRSIRDRDTELAQKIIATDITIDEQEVDIEEECQKILALHQPVAHDLRFIIAVLKINNELERIGDATVNIAERSLYLASQERMDMPFDFSRMSEKVQSMLHQSLDALVNQDARLAYGVISMDDEVDAINREMYSQVKKGLEEQPGHIESLVHLLGVSRHLERIGDYASNIAEDVIYLVQGEIVRHKAEEYLQVSKRTSGPV
ncbi:MAG: hypothetical protein AMXMBFR84_13700 [Candidatus Hydrogenedentota bacterium]